MNIETLQIKRVTGNWETYKSYEPADGEPVFIDIDDNEKDIHIHCIVVGAYEDRESAAFYPLEELITMTSRVILTKSWSDSLMNAPNQATINYLTPPTTVAAPPAIAATGSAGDDNRFARLNHSHALEKSTVESILKVRDGITTDYHCRKIKAGTQDPSTSNVGGSVGDIYIRYES